MSLRANCRSFARWSLYALLFVAVLGAVGAHIVYVKLHGSLPRTTGTIAMPGLDAPVDILRDEWGVPHIFAQSRRDAIFAQGFVHAQDRLWQMELSRRIGRGRLSEILGASTLSTDRLMRTFDFSGLARQLEPSLPEAARTALEAYAAGVNAYLASHDGPLPPEFLLSGLGEPEPWTAEDSIILIKLMAFRLATNWWSELAHARLIQATSPEIFAALYPQFPALPAPTALYGLPLPSQEHTGLVRPIAGASNNWAVDGRWTKSGKPLLANDPHLGLTIPSTFYLAHLSHGGHDIIGASLAGVPGIILGRNNEIAWGYTNTGADVQDFYLEKLAKEPAGHYISSKGARPFLIRTETIEVKGGSPVTETFRATEHGPVLPADHPLLFDLLPEDHVLALAWDALKEGDRTMAAGLAIMEADGADSFIRAVEPYVTPMQNMVFADKAGRIGFIAPGHVPIRDPLNETRGLLPAPGWMPGYDWTGTVPFAELPRILDPADGHLVTANNEIVDERYPYSLSHEWDDGRRAQRIAELLTSRRDHDAASFAAMQRDAVSLEARALLPKLLARLEPAAPRETMGTGAAERLSRWDGAMTADAPEPLIFAAWIYEIDRALMANAVGKTHFNLVRGWRFDIIGLVLDGAPAQQRFCGGDGNRAACDALIREAFGRALQRLAADHGERLALWRWGQKHEASFENHPFGLHPLFAPLVNRAIASDGGADTINRGLTHFNSPEPFANIHGPVYRAIYDLAADGKSMFMISTGQSGNPLSRHYDDLMPLWARGDYIPMITARGAIEAKGPERLSLLPAQGH